MDSASTAGVSSSRGRHKPFSCVGSSRSGPIMRAVRYPDWSVPSRGRIMWAGSVTDRRGKGRLGTALRSVVPSAKSAVKVTAPASRHGAGPGFQISMEPKSLPVPYPPAWKRAPSSWVRQGSGRLVLVAAGPRDDGAAVALWPADCDRGASALAPTVPRGEPPAQLVTMATIRVEPPLTSHRDVMVPCLPLQPACTRVDGPGAESVVVRGTCVYAALTGGRHGLPRAGVAVSRSRPGPAPGLSRPRTLARQRRRPGQAEVPCPFDLWALTPIDCICTPRSRAA